MENAIVLIIKMTIIIPKCVTPCTRQVIEMYGELSQKITIRLPRKHGKGIWMYHTINCHFNNYVNIEK